MVTDILICVWPTRVSDVKFEVSLMHEKCSADFSKQDIGMVVLIALSHTDQCNLVVSLAWG